MIEILPGHYALPEDIQEVWSEGSVMIVRVKDEERSFDFYSEHSAKVRVTKLVKLLSVDPVFTFNHRGKRAQWKRARSN